MSTIAISSKSVLFRPTSLRTGCLRHYTVVYTDETDTGVGWEELRVLDLLSVYPAKLVGFSESVRSLASLR